MYRQTWLILVGKVLADQRFGWNGVSYTEVSLPGASQGQRWGRYLKRLRAWAVIKKKTRIHLYRLVAWSCVVMIYHYPLVIESIFFYKHAWCIILEASSTTVSSLVCFPLANLLMPPEHQGRWISRGRCFRTWGLEDDLQMCFLFDSEIVMRHESQFLWVGLPNRSPSTWTQIIKDKFRWFLSNFGDSARFFLALGSVEEGPSNDNVTFWTIKRGSKGQTYTNELREHGFARVGQITGRFSQDHGSIFTQVRWFAIHGSCCGVVDCF